MSLFIYERDENGTPTHFYIGRLRFKIDQNREPIAVWRVDGARDQVRGYASTSACTTKDTPMLMLCRSSPIGVSVRSYG